MQNYLQRQYLRGTTVDCSTLLLHLSLSLSLWLPLSLCWLGLLTTSEVKQFVRNVSLDRSDLLRKQGGNHMRNIGGEYGARYQGTRAARSQDWPRVRISPPFVLSSANGGSEQLC